MATRLALPLFLALVLLPADCTNGPPPAPQGEHGLDLSAMNASVAPGDDFFTYANGDWVRTTAIPADRATYGVFAQLREVADRRTAELIRQAADAHAAGGETAKVGAFYATYLDEAAIDGKGTAPLQPQLAAIAAIGDRRELARVLGTTLRADVDALNNTNFHTARLFGLWVAPDFARPDRCVAYLLQGGLGLPDRDYYLKTDSKMVERQVAYRAHIKNVL